MKDRNDNATRDAFNSPRRGRPPKDSALDGATRQRQLREARKAAGWKRLEVSPDELALIREALWWDRDSTSNPDRREGIVALLRRLGPVLRG